MPTLAPEENPPELSLNGQPTDRMLGAPSTGGIQTVLPRRNGNSTPQNWYLIYTKSRQEKPLAWRLKRLNLSYYLPMGRYQTTAHRQQVVVQKPLFPGYLFAYAKHHALGDALQTAKKHVVTWQIVRNPKKLQQELTTLWKASQHLHAYRPSPEALTVGKEIEFIDGPLQGLRSKIHAVLGKSRSLVVELDVELLGAAHFEVDLTKHAVRLIN